MTAKILVVDDIPANVKLLEAKLASEYYGVITAKDGFEAIEQTKLHKPDLVLLDVMMPGMDGFETCKKLKEDGDVSHIPVVMVTALSDQSDRIRGLEAGADDFLTKPINDMALFARVKSLVRIKVLLDELRLRDQTRTQLGVQDNSAFTLDVTGSKVLLIDDDVVQAKQISGKLTETYKVEVISDCSDADGVIQKAATMDFDCILVSTLLSDTDGLRLASLIKGREEARHVPVLMLVDEDDTKAMFKGLEMGINDYLRVPIDKNEMTARVKTQIRRKKYQEALRSTYQQSISMAITDGLTGLYNRHYLNTHIGNMVSGAANNFRPLSVIIMDMDHFKMVNDTHGHDSGDKVLKQLSDIILKSLRSSDLAARFGGEEFVLLLPETPREAAQEVAERIRETVQNTPFVIKDDGTTINKTVSIGVATLKLEGPGKTALENGEALIKRADEVLYQAKNGGRNKVMVAE